jgi:hypothetical protein
MSGGKVSLILKISIFNDAMKVIYCTILIFLLSLSVINRRLNADRADDFNQEGLSLLKIAVDPAVDAAGIRLL